MVGTIETVFLGCAEKVSEKGNTYRVVSFLENGTPVSCMLASEYKGELPKALTECELDIQVTFGRYMNAKVVGVREM